MLYATGGLVLGETMALFLTADQGFFWLAAMLAVLCCALSGSFRRGAAGGGGGTPALFLTEKAGPWLRFGLAAAGCIPLGFGRMQPEIQERVTEEQETDKGGGGHRVWTDDGGNRHYGSAGDVHLYAVPGKGRGRACRRGGERVVGG